MNWEKRDQNSIHSTVRWKEKNNSWINRNWCNKRFRRNRYTPNSGNLIWWKKKKENDKRLKKRRNWLEIQWLYWIGRKTLEEYTNNKKDRLLTRKDKCLIISGRQRKSMRKKWRGKSLFWTVRGTWSWFVTMKLRSSWGRNRRRLRRREIRWCSIML